MDHIIKQADKLVRRYKTRNPFEIADHLNITVKYGEFTQLKGFYNYTYRNRFIVINSQLNEIEQNITCSHELGHDRLHRKEASIGLMRDEHLFNVADIYEREANLFAAQLLIDNNDFLDCVSMKYSSAQIASALNTHEELAIIKGIILNRQGYNVKYSISAGFGVFGEEMRNFNDPLYLYVSSAISSACIFMYSSRICDSVLPLFFRTEKS
jgi:Zn-dependent peptidase ImmA (M78 family)